MEIWTPVVGEILVVKIEPTNRHYIDAVAIYRDAEIVGYDAYNLAPRMTAFFIRENKAFALIMGAKVYRSDGSGSTTCLPPLCT